MERRRFLKGAAWSLPVIAAAVATPLASASVTEPEKEIVYCSYLGNHGQGGDTGNGWWRFFYSDGTSEDFDNGTVMSTPELKKWAKKK